MWMWQGKTQATTPKKNRHGKPKTRAAHDEMKGGNMTQRKQPVNKPIGNVFVRIDDMPGRVPGITSVKQVRDLRKLGLKCLKVDGRLHAWTLDVVNLLMQESK